MEARRQGDIAEGYCKRWGVYIQCQTTAKGNKWRAVYVLFRVLNLETLINGIRKNLKEEKETKENWNFDSKDRNFE